MIFRQICNDNKLNTGIVELVFLGEVQHPYIGKTFTDENRYMEFCENIYNYSWIELPDGYVMTTTSLRDSFAIYSDIIDKYVGDADEAANVLPECLPNLRNLSKIRIASKIDKSGLNQEAYFFAKDYEHAGTLAYEKSEDGNSAPCQIRCRR